MIKNKIVCSYIYSLLLLVSLVSTATAIGYVFSVIGFHETNIVLVYLLAVLIIACFSKGYIVGVIASIIATLAFNYFFTRPNLSLSVDDPSYMITFVIMTATALITSTLTSRIKQGALQSIAKEAQTNTLYALTNRLTDARDIDAISSIVINSISECLCNRAALVYFEEENAKLPITFVQDNANGTLVRRKLENSEELRSRINSLDSSYSIGLEFWDWPIHSGDCILGIIRIPSENAVLLTPPQISLLQSMIESVSLAIDRFQTSLRKIKADEEAVQERYHANLLRSISHDLRTPLSGIIGTSEMLINMTDDSDIRHSLIKGIHKEADWLHSIVENILSLTRLQDGKLNLHTEYEAVEEVVGGAVAHITKRYPNRAITVIVPQEVLMVPMDAKLIQQVIINLLDNAAQHTSIEKEIAIGVSKDEDLGYAIFTVTDSGAGIGEDQLPMLFNAFYTSRDKMPDSKRGIGLGLTICEAIVTAHSGQIKASNRKATSGAEFIFTLPLEVSSNGAN